MSSEIQVTIVVLPRERFSYTERSLENIYESTNFPFKLVYIDGNSPAPVRHYLEEQSRQKQFKLVRTNHFLNPNQYRNLGLSYVDTPYVVFIDNDVLVKPGWLDALVRCADETNAWIVGPLCLEGEDFKTIHMVGGTSEFREKNGKLWLVERRPMMKLPLTKVASELQNRQKTEILEFHCMLVRTEAFRQLGQLDEKLMSMLEESDFCMRVTQSGQAIYLEPAAVITYVPPAVTQLKLYDLPFFFVRWSDHWCQKSVERFHEKWNLSEDALILKRAQNFVRAHRYVADPQPQHAIQYAAYGMRRIILKLVKEFMNYRATGLSQT
jgi:GT2 family glycosyltransferase